MIRLLYFMLGSSVTMSLMVITIFHKVPHSLSGVGALLIAIAALESTKQVTR